MEDEIMKKMKPKLLTLCIVAALLVGVAVSPAEAARVLWQAAGTDIYLGRPANTLEFENPAAVGKWVDTYRILNWRDADYGGVPAYKDWTVSHPSEIDGCPTEIWMRNNTHSIQTTTTVPSNVVSIHLNGDDNDGIAEVNVDGTLRARIDMGVRGNPQTALVIVKYLPFTTHTIKVKDAGKGPSQLGDDVATFGAAALGSRKWFPRYWYLDGRIRLLRTFDRYSGLVIPVTVPNGYWGGWWWWHHQCTWFWPWYGGIGWYWPYYYNYPYWQYWNYWPYYRYYAPWWRNWQWRGGPWFWGFKKCLTYRYTYPIPRILYWWSWYWDPSGQGNCVELVTMADESNPAGGRVMPVEEEVIGNLTVDSHEFSVNGDDASGSFSNLEWVTIGSSGSGLRSQFMSMTGANVEDTNAFMESEIVQQLLANSEGHPTARVGLQYATWNQNSIAPMLNLTAESIIITEGTGYTYDVNLPSSPGVGQTVTVTITPSSEAVRLGSHSPGESLVLNFNEFNWYTPQHVDVNAVNDTEARGGNETVQISHSLSSTNPTFNKGGMSVEVTVQDDEPGGLGFVESDLDHDGKVNLKDFDYLANEWLTCTNPNQDP
jgi:hypothetical protein